MNPASWKQVRARAALRQAVVEVLETRALFAAAGLVAAYGFDEGSGGTALDASGRSNHGTVSGAVWSASGRFGGALSFDGVNDVVNVADSASLDLTTGMTLQAWVRPTTTSGYRTAVMKDVPGELAYALYSSNSSGRPNTWARIGGASRDATGTSALPTNAWSHLAATYDGSALLLFVNGTQVASRPVTGAIQASTNPFHVGGNPIWGEYFAGLIDEVRVYNRALTAAEIQADMNAAVATPPEPDTTAPTVSLTAPAAGGQVSGIIAVNAAASDNVAVVGVQFKLDGVNLGAEDTSAPYTVNWNTTTVALGNHTLTAVARDAAGNVTTSSAIVVSVADTVAPSVSITSPVPGALMTGSVTVTATASDDRAVGGVQFLLDGVPIGSEDTSAPYSFTWDTTAHPGGPHTLSARARDGSGNQTTSGGVAVTIDNRVDAAPPTVSVTSPAGGSSVSGSVNVTAAAADDIGVVGVRFFVDGNPIGVEDTTAPYGVSWNAASAAPGAHAITAVARDAAGRSTTSDAIAVTVADGLAPTVAVTSPANAAGVSGVVTVTASASDNVGVVGVQFFLNGQALGSEDAAAPYSASWDATAAAAGTYTLTAVARDAAGNSTTSAPVSVRVGSQPGLVAHYSFDETSGTLATDRSGSANHGTVSGATWSTSGRFGGALSFDGVNDVVNVADSASLDLTTGMTLQAWVRPTTASGYRTAVMKDVPGELSYALYSSDSSGRPNAWGRVNSSSAGVTGPSALPLNAWSHLAATYNGSALVLYVNGVQVATRAAAGSLTTSSNPFHVGGNPIWGEYFAGLIDEVRVYNRALTTAEIQADMNAGGGTPTPDTSAPNVLVTAPAAGAAVGGSVTVTATASDNVGVTGVQFRVNGVNYGAEDTTAPYSIVWDTALAANGGYELTAVARDAAGNVTTSAPITVTVNNSDTAAPSVAISSPAAGSSVSGAAVALSAAASDNVGVVGVQFLIDGVAVGAEDTSAPYAMAWDSRQVGNGTHSVTARARDAAGNFTTSASVTVTVSNASTNPAVVGQWGAVRDVPIVAMSTVLLNNGKVLMWDGGPACIGSTSARVWDPLTDTYTAVPLPYFEHKDDDIFCSAQALLADGRVLVVGGHDCDGPQLGIRMVNIFDPVTMTWTRGPDMEYRRWYPTATTLADGRVLVTAGSVNTTTDYVPVPEIYDPVTNSWTTLTAANRTIPNYPFVFQTPDGKVLVAGSDEAKMGTHVLDVATQTWSTVDSRILDAGSAVMYLPGKVLKAGSSYLSPPADNGGSIPSAATTYVLDATQAGSTWSQTASMAYARTHLNLTILPDGTVLATGGSTDIGGVNPASAVYAAEVWSPATNSWTTLASAQRPRMYHSTATLLPDGRVLVAGGGHNYYNNHAEFNAEIFSPAYLFKGARPTVGSAPATLAYNTNFFVGTPDAASIASVSLIRNGSATHSVNMDQRFVPLTFQQTAGGLTVQAPLDANVATPGTYMLFLVNSNGVPSIAPFVRLPAAYEDNVPPTAPVNLVAAGGLGTVSLTWSAASDNNAVTRYSVYRSLTAGFTPSAANRIARVTATSYTDQGVAAGTYYYVVRAEDAAGNLSPASNQASGTAAADAVAPSITLTSPVGGSTASGVVSLTADASDNVGVAGVQFLLDGQPIGAEDTTAPYAIAWNSGTVSNGSHTVTARARDAAGNTTASTGAVITVSNTSVAQGLVAYYRFDEGSGATAVDASGRLNHGTVSGAVWTASGRFGGALSFDGVNDIVNVADSDSLDLTTGMTLQAWVRPTSQAGYRTAVMKDVPGELAYALYSSEPSGRPNAWGRVNSTSTGVTGPSALPLNAWSHLAATYNGSALALYVNGTQVASVPTSGSLLTSSNPFHVGGNPIWGEYFAGLIDEVRVYNRALSAAEIQADMNSGGGPVAQTYAITGSISPGTSGAGAQLTLGGATTATVTADATGGFSFVGVPDGSYTVTPVKSGYSFSPGSQSVVVSGGNVTGINFTATEVPVTPTGDIAFIAKAATGNEGATPSMSITLANIRPGSFLIVTGTCARPSNTLSISDSLGNVFELAVGPIVHVEQNVAMYVWYVRNAIGGTSTFTITPGVTSALEIHVSEWSGIDKANPIDQISHATGNGSAVSSGVKTTTVNGELIFGYAWVERNASPGSGFTALSLINGDLDEYRIQQTAGPVEATFTQSASGWLALMITFRPTPVAPPAQIQASLASVQTSTSVLLASPTGTSRTTSVVPAQPARIQPLRRKRLLDQNDVVGVAQELK